MAVHARTLEIYSKLGLAERALELGRPGYGANVWANRQLKARIPFKDMGKGLSPFPYVLMLGQDDNERIMGEHLRQWDIAVHWNTELVAFEQRPDRVVATIKDPDGSTRTIAAAYVAGCDGSRSSVRELSGIGFPGAPYEHTFFVADTDATGPMVADELNVFLRRTGFHLYFPMRGTNAWRVIGILPRELSTKDPLTFEELVPSLVQAGGSGLSFSSCHWFSTYRIHHRCTERFRDRRCFLLGDAAHVHSPMGGQGMNTGLQDAYNLAWKLALVVSDRADQTLLDTYEAERAPVRCSNCLPPPTAPSKSSSPRPGSRGCFARRSFLALPRSPWAESRCSEPRSGRFRRSASAIGQSPLSRTLEGVSKKAPQAGDRFPWLRLKYHAQGAPEDLFQRMDDTRFNLIVIGQPAPSAESLGLGDMLQVHAIAADAEQRPRACRSVHRRPGVLSRPSRRAHRPRRHPVSGGRPETVAGGFVAATREAGRSRQCR